MRAIDSAQWLHWSETSSGGLVLPVYRGDRDLPGARVRKSRSRAGGLGRGCGSGCGSLLCVPLPLPLSRGVGESERSESHGLLEEADSDGDESP